MKLQVIFILCAFCINKSHNIASDDLKSFDQYSAFLNFGDNEVLKSNYHNYSNGIFKSKVDVLGKLFKNNIDVLKAYRQLDLIFLIDSSSSVGENNFKSEIKFVKKLLSDVTVDYNHTRIAIVVFSSKNYVVKAVDEITKPKKENNKCVLLNKELNNIRFRGGSTYTVGAFRAAKTIFYHSRKEAKKVLFLITDGYSNGGDPTALADELKKDDVTIFTIGIRNGNYKELYTLSTSPGEFYSYLLDSFQEFESLARRALHVDIQSGEYVPLGTDVPCNILCTNGSCCDKNAICTCGISTGHFTCLCKPGYYGSGLQNSCTSCPSGTYSNEPNLCLPCPNVHHITVPPAEGINSCKCKTGYRATKDHECETIKCKKLAPPEHGYFVKRQECGNVLNNACGVRCEVGYTLSGNSIRLCQINGSWSGNSPSCQVKTCLPLASPLHGKISCSHSDLGILYNETEASLPVDTMCTFKCGNGRVLTGSPQRTCLPVAQWDGLKTSCKQIKCNKLSALPHGKIEPEACTTRKQAFGTNCTYTCQPGYRLQGPKVRSCTEKHGRWSNRNSHSSCEDVTPPKVECPKNIVANTTRGKMYGVVSWENPNVTDNSNLEVTVWSKPAIKNITAFKFKIGKTKVTYFAQDAFNNIAKCNFTVEIQDNEPPTIENCVDPVTFLTTESAGANVSWDEPIIFDNSKNVTINKSENSGFFKIGLTQVVYTAKDASNNSNSCVLNITVEESQCQPLPSPMFGNSNCSSMDNGINCVITCEDGYAIPISGMVDSSDIEDNSTQFTCDNSDQMWFSQQNLYHPDCTITELPTEISQKGVITVEPDSSSDVCNNLTKLHELENEVKINLNNDLDSACTDVLCSFNASAFCEDLERSEFEEKTNIIKREAIDKKPKNDQLIKINFEVHTKIYKKNFALSNMTFLNNLQNVNLHNLGNNTGKVIGVRIEKTNVMCPRGSVPKKFKCVQCPKGTFHNIMDNVCQSCDLGFYNDKFGQSSCIICPINYSTTKMHCKSLNDCISVCPPGTHSRRKKLKPSRHHPNTTISHTTLMPYCRPCSLGSYQSNYGQLTCRKCSEGYTTSTIRATNINECVPNVEPFCGNNTTLCKNGQCVSHDEFSYSCLCEEYYIGSHCEIKLNSCSSNPCLNNASCAENNDLDEPYICTCHENYYGKHCEYLNEECKKNCYNNGTCLKNEDDEEECFCTDGFAGTFCEITLKFCRDNFCENGGQCLEESYGFKCICQNGFIGRRCNILPCDYKPCPITHICSNINEATATKLSYTCECPKGYEGFSCSDKIDFCKSKPCLNDGMCTSLDDDFSCTCPKIFTGVRCEVERNSDYILQFPRSGTTDFVKVHGFSHNLNEISVCLWLSTEDNFNYGTILSYATSKYDNAFTLTDYSGLVLYINGDHVVTDVFLNDGRWHFVCVTWESLDGAYKIYVDGNKKQNGTGLATSAVIEGGGTFIIGQEQDILGGKFSQSESFLGNITYLDVWGHSLNDSEILYNMNSCSNNIFGDIYAWAEISNFVYGDVEILNSTFCKKCVKPRLLNNGFVEIVNNVAYYNCHPGYELNIPLYALGRKCTKASKWEGPFEPECKRIFCGYPGYVMNSNIIGNSYYYLDTVTYECKNNYNLKGSNIRKCTENGTWFPEKPICVGIQCPNFPKPLNSEISILTDLNDDNLGLEENLDVGTQFEIKCVNETKIEGENLLTCLENGTWDFPTPKCVGEKLQFEELPCPIDQLPTPPTNGYVVLETLSAYYSGMTNMVDYQCRQGYQLRGENFTTCILDGYWTELTISCDQIICENPPTFEGTVIKNAVLLNTTYYYGNMVNFDCTEGYRFYGSPTIRCLANGQWSHMQGKCIRKSCHKPNVRKTTTIVGNSFLYQDRITLICANNGRYVLVCSSARKWIGNQDKSC